jgi:hypothetical protein
MKLPEGLTAQQIRVLQEFRRMSKETLSVEEVNGIRHPTDGGVAPAQELAASGYLSAATDGTTFSLTEKAKELLALDWKPYSERG